MSTLEDYAFEERLRGMEGHFLGLEKLRCIEDPKMRKQLWDLHGIVENRPRPAPRQQAIAWDQKPDRTCVERPEESERYP